MSSKRFFMAEFISLYSGSSGNSSVVRCGSRYLIVDMGKGVRTTSAALKALGLAVSDCDGILVTHEHSDHVKGLSTFLKKNPLPVYGAAATRDFLDANGIVPVSCERWQSANFSQPSWMSSSSFAEHSSLERWPRWDSMRERK